MTSLSVVSIISQWPIWIVFHLLRWNILSKQKEEKPLISLYASATQRPRTSLEALLQSWNLNHLSWNEKALGGRSFELYHENVSSIHKNIKKDRGTKNEFHWRIFCKTLIRQHSCTTHCVQTVPVLAAILQRILWNSMLSIFNFCNNKQMFIINTYTVKHTHCIVVWIDFRCMWEK